MVGAIFRTLRVVAALWLRVGVSLAGGSVLFLACACGGADTDNAPAEVLSRFLEAMDRSVNNEAALKDAFALLDSTAQRELTARANRAGFLTGRKFEPWEMIAQGRFRLRFAPVEHAMRTTIKGSSAVVHVKSDDARANAVVPLVREAGGWRVKLSLPELARVAPSATAER